MMRLLSLCAGIGGADLAASWTGAITVVGQVEIDPFCLSVLARHFPDAKRIPDIREVQGSEFGDIDIVVAGIPCQPYSHAGKRAAARDHRDLWPPTRRILGEARPSWFVLENVEGLLSATDEQQNKGQYFGSILSDLAALGYRVGWAVFGASDVGAPHQRRRVFLVAHTRSREDRGVQRTRIATNSCPQSPRSVLAHTDEQRLPLRKGSQRPARTLPESDRHRADTGNVEPGMVRGSHGLSRWLDCHRWPAGPGQAQHDWEPPRTIKETQPSRRARLKALGNAIVPQHIFPLFAALVAQVQQDRNE